MSSLFIFSQDYWNCCLIYIQFSSYLVSSLIQLILWVRAFLRVFTSLFSSCFKASSSSTFSLALSALHLASSSSTPDFYFTSTVFSYFCFFLNRSIYSSFRNTSLEISLILLYSSCSMTTSFCSLFIKSLILAFSFVQSKFKLASTFLNCFSFSMSDFFCCSAKPVQNYAYFCLRTSLALAYSVFFQVSNSHTTFCYRLFN